MECQVLDNGEYDVFGELDKPYDTKRRKMHDDKTPHLLICRNIECSKEFTSPWTGRQWNTRKKYCSEICNREGRGNILRKNGHISKEGYRRHKVMGQVVYEHIKIMEKYLGRKLHKNETIHHIDGDKLNNKLSNLELRMFNHGKGQRVSGLYKITVNDYVLGALSL